ncbi:MAG: lipopolysaccharide biosynthesis protein [Eubacteriales bacterium]
MNRYSKLASNTAILSVGTLASKVLVYLLLPLYTACLSPDEYSMADLISQTANLLLPILAVGMVDGIFRFAMDKTDEAGKAKVFCVSTVTITLGSLLAFAILPLLGKTGFFGSYTWLIPLYVIASNYHMSAAHFLRGCGKTKLFALQGIICTALTIALNLLFLLVFDMGVSGYVLSVICADFLVALMLYFGFGLIKYIKPHSFDMSVLREMLKYSVPMIPTTIFWWITNVADRYMITYIDGQYVNGLYAAAFRIPTLLILVSGIFSEAWQYSAVTDSDGGNDGDFFSRVFDSFQSIVFLAASVLILLAKVFTDILFADTYSDAWQYIPVLVAATVFSSLVTFMSSVYVKHKRSVNSFVTAMIGALSNILLNALLIPVLSAQGAALATLLCYVIVYVIRVIDAKRYVRFNTKPFVIIISSLIIGLQCALMLIGFRFWWLYGIFAAIGIAIIDMRPLIASFKTVWNMLFSRFVKKI